MGNKNNNRYNTRKRNSVKHESKKLFTEPPLLIKNWEELSKVKSDTHFIEVEIENCCGYIRPMIEVPDEEYYDHNYYLTTHTFYGSQYFITTELLRKCGFNVQLLNWDGETIYSRN